MYKVLDVREIVKVSGSSYSREAYGSGGSLNIKNSVTTVVIAEDEKKERCRFTFCPATKEEFLGETMHYGTKGDYDILIPGDMFEIEREVDTWPYVKLIKNNH